jgi:hypothetical protein
MDGGTLSKQSGDPPAGKEWRFCPPIGLKEMTT